MVRQVRSSYISVIWLTGHQVIQQSSDLVERDHSRSAAVLVLASATPTLHGFFRDNPEIGMFPERTSG